MHLNCPSCNSDNTQSLPGVFENGLSNVNTQTKGVGLGLGRGGLGIAVGAASTAGTSQTATSQRAAPPDKKTYLKPLAIIFAVGVVIQLMVSGTPLQFLGALATLLCGGGSIGWVYHAYRFNSKTWPQLMAQWSDTFLCHRCSHVFTLAR